MKSGMTRLALGTVALLLAPPALAEPVADLEGPVGGWRNSKLTNGLEQYTVAYPKFPVDHDAQKYRTFIAGCIRAAGKQRRPPVLTVNGNAIPLYGDGEGRSARPWAFGPGSDNVEIVSASGQSRQRLQFYEADTTKTSAKLHAVLTWDDPCVEVDMHVTSPIGDHTSWARPLPSDGGGLDVDSVDGAGPEILSTAAPRPGVWLFYVNYWSNSNAGGYNFDEKAHDRDLITAQLALIYNENTLNERYELASVPLHKIDKLALMKSIRF